MFKEDNLIQVILTTIAAISAVVVSILAIWQSDSRAETALVNDNINRIVKIESDMKHISYMLEELKTNQMTQQQMRELLKDIFMKQP